MRVFLFLLVIGWLVLMPLTMIKQPWAMRVMKRVRTGFFIYVLVMVLAAVIVLIMRWDQFYG